MATKRPLVNNAGTLNEIATGDTLLASGFSIPSGTSTQFLKADGTTDATTYAANSEVTRASIRPSLLLDFANSKTLDPRITFTRNSTASYYGKDGLLKTAAINSPRFDHNPTTGESLGLLIEEQRTNLLTYSEQFDNVIWNKNNTTITANAITAPDGTSTADVLTKTASLSYINQQVSFSANTSYTLSIYAKKNITSGYLSITTQPTYPNRAGATFDLTSGTIIGYASPGGSTTTITAINMTYISGWYRCSMTFSISGAAVGYLYIGATELTGSYTDPFGGSVLADCCIWGAQLEVGAFPTSYIPSTDTFTSRATTGTYIGSNGLIQTAAINTARLNYNPLNLALSPKLLLESASTNLLTYSEQFDDVSWSKRSGSTIITNSIIAPDGTLTADTHTNTDTVVSSTYIRKSNVFSTDNTNYCVSAFVKRGSQPYVKLVMYSRLDNLNYAAAFYNLDTRLLSITNIGSVTGTTTGMIYYGNGWWRIWCSSNMLTGTNGTGFDITPCDWTTPTAIGSEYGYLWGIQVEQGVYPTSYIPTTSAQVTRAADVSSSAQSTRIADSAVMTGTNFSSWYRQDEGTVFVKYKYENPTNSTGLYPCTIDINDGTTNNNITQLTQSSSNLETFGVRSNKAAMADLYSSQAISTTTSNIVAGVYQSNSFAACLNGLSPQTDSSGNVPVNVYQMTIGTSNNYYWLNGRIAKIAYYPKRLTNTELQALTTL